MFNKRLIQLVEKIKPMILKKAILMWASMIFSILIWFSFAYIISSLYNNSLSVFKLAACLSLVILCVILRYANTVFISSYTADIAQKVKLELRNRIYKKLAKLGAGYKNIYTTAEITQLSTEGIEQIEIYFTQYLPQLLYSVLAPITLFVVFIFALPKAAAALLLCVPLIPIAIASVQTVAKRLLSKYWDSYTSLGDSFLENLQGLITLKIYDADKDKHEEMNKEAENFRRITMKVLGMQLNSITVMDIAAYGGTALGLLMCYLELKSGNIPIVNVIALIFLVSEFFVPMRLLGSYFHIAMNGVAASEKIFRILDEDTPDLGYEDIHGGDLYLENVSFSYDNQRQIINDISLKISRNSITGICGASGCGKSTLASIISGRNFGYSGRVLLEESEYKSASRSQIYDHVVYAGCNDYIFSGTIRECLCEADNNASEKKMVDVLKKVRLWELASNNGGLDMRLKQNCSNLSGGQKQRLTLARAFMKNCDVYIFDEITSNVDAQSEEIILDAIYELSKNHTVIIITHKLTNISVSDMIYYMSDGKIIEQGTHAELLKLNGEYCRTYYYQKELEKYSKEDKSNEKESNNIRSV